ncbi:hypothetical protein SALBM135S_02576 [Streptomyces alboniger]
MRLLLDLRTGDHGCEGQSGAEGLGQGQDVGHHTVALEGVPGSGAAETGLRLIQDQQHAALSALGPQGGEVPGGWLDDAARAEDRLDETRGQAAGRLGVDQVEGEVQLSAPVQGAVGCGEVGPVGVRYGDGEVAGGARAVALAARTVGGGRGCLRHAVPGPGEGDDLVLAGDELGHAERGFVGLGACRQEEGLLQWRGQGVGEPAGEVDHGTAEHAAVEVVEVGDLPLDGGDDRRVRVAENRTHLARGEVEYLAAVRGEHEASGGALDDFAGEVASVADEVPIGFGPEGGGERGGGSQSSHA